MDDDKIKDLFKGFDPELSSDFMFLDRLQQKMDAVELAKQYHRSMRKRSRMAIAIAALAGFIVGVVCTLAFPLISAWMADIDISLPLYDGVSLDEVPHVLGYILLAGVSVITSLNVYEIAMARLPRS